MFWLKLLKSIIKILHSNISPKEIARGVIFGLILGLTPFFCLHNLLVILIVILFKVNISTVILCTGIFGIVGHFIDPLLHELGSLLLIKADFLTPFWTRLYNMPIVPFTRFNNTIVLGSLVLSLVVLIPLYFLSKRFIIYYRSNLRYKVEKLKLVKILKLTKIYNFYQKVRGS